MRFPTELSLHIPCFPTPATCPVHLSLLDLTVINQNYEVTSTAGSITRSVAQRSLNVSLRTAESHLQNTPPRTNSAQVSSTWNPIVRFQHNVRPSPHAEYRNSFKQRKPNTSPHTNPQPCVSCSLHH